MTKKLRNYVTMAICLLGIIFALAYPYVAHGEIVGDIMESTVEIVEPTALDPVLFDLEQQLVGLKNQLAFEQLIAQNLDLKFRLNQTQIAQLENLKANLQNLRMAFAQSQEKIKSLQAQILDLENEITAASKGTPAALEKKE